MVVRSFLVLLTAFALSGCASSPTFLAVKDQPREQWSTIDDALSQMDTRQFDAQGLGFSTPEDVRGNHYIYRVERFFDSTTSDLLPEETIIGVLGYGESVGRVFVPLQYINKLWLDNASKYDFYKFTHDLGVGDETLATLYENPQFRYLDVENQRIGYATLYSAVLSVNKSERTAKNAFASRSKSRIFPLTVITSAEASSQMTHYKTMSEQHELKVEQAQRKRQLERRTHFLNAQKKPFRVGNFVCSRDNRVAAVEVVGEDALKLSMIGQVHHQPDYYLYQDIDHFRIDQSNFGQLFWAKKKSFARCDGLTITN